MAVTWDDARRQAYAAAQPLPPVALPLPDAAGAVLAEPLAALVDLPAFDHAAMDGYAVCGEPPWTLTGRSAAGGPAVPALSPGTACEIATGATVPAGTGAVLPYEHASRTGVRVHGTVAPGRHIRRAGEECVAGEKLLAAGVTVTPPVVGLAAALGHDRLTVHPAPRVAALITGDELLATGLPGAGRIRDAIGPMLPGVIAWCGGQLAAVDRVGDTEKALAEALSSADAPLVLVSGSSSIGPADHLHSALRALGAQLVVNTVACRPGHPQTLAGLPDGRLVVGLPGNPLAAVVALLTLALPVITGLRDAELPELPVVAAPGVARHRSDTRLVPVRVGDSGAEPLPHAGSAMLRGLALADGLAVVPPREAVPVRLHPVPRGAGAWAG